MTTEPASPNDERPADPFATGVAAEFKAEPFRFGFFQAVRLLERAAPNRRPVGSDGSPDEEAVRFRTHVTQGFPASEVHEFRPSADGKPPRLVVNFLGLVGSMGALPQPYTDLVVERRFRHRDRTLHDFLDLFSHRLLGLFYRAWAKYRTWTNHETASRLERQRRTEGEAARRAFVLQERPAVDPASQALLDLIGLGEPALRYRTGERERLAPRGVPGDEALRFFSGLLAQRHRSAAGLEAMLSAHFGHRCRVRSFVGRWLVLDDAELARVGVPGRSELGSSLVAGKRVYDVQSKFRVTLGPMTYAAFADCLPPGTAHRPVHDFVRLYAGPELEYDLELRLLPEEVPDCRLGGPAGGRLGWTTWLSTGAYRGEPAVILAPRESA